MGMLHSSPGLRVTLTLVWLAGVAFLLAHLASLFVAEAIGAKVGPMDRSLPISSKPFLPSTQELGNLILNSSVFSGDRRQSALRGPSRKGGQDRSIELSQVELLGTVVGGKAWSYAIIQSAQSTRQSLYRLGDWIPQVGTLVHIDRHQVIIGLEDGQHATLEAKWMNNSSLLSQADSVLDLSGNEEDGRITMQRREIVEAFSDLPRVLQQAKATPIIAGTGMDGVSFEVIGAASIFERLGFQIGDELKSINGVALRDPGTLLTALRQIQHESAVDLDVVRNNQHITMHYDIQ